MTNQPRDRSREAAEEIHHERTSHAASECAREDECRDDVIFTAAIISRVVEEPMREERDTVYSLAKRMEERAEAAEARMTWRTQMDCEAELKEALRISTEYEHKFYQEQARVSVLESVVKERDSLIGAERIETRAAGLTTQEAELIALRAKVGDLQHRDSEAAQYVESVIAMRTDFSGEEPYVGWKGLGLSLTEALDERDSLRAKLAAAEKVVEAARSRQVGHNPLYRDVLSDAIAAYEAEWAKGSAYDAERDAAREKP